MTDGYRDTVLKGGSLNTTVLRTFDDGRKIVRKSISRTVEREYGFVRWHSQFKRMQRYNRLFPGLFPVLLDAGEAGDAAFFDMEYIDGSVDLKRHLAGEAPIDLAALNRELWTALDRMHDHASFSAFPGSLALYFEEEVRQRLRDALAEPSFRSFAEQDEVVVDGRPAASLARNLDWLGEAFRLPPPKDECYTHGNVTLENVLVVPGSGRLVFVDPYDENVVDCREAEYSQVLQCSSRHYGYINDRTVRVSGPEVMFDGTPPARFAAFNALFQSELERRLGEEQIRLVRLLEASQFVRMLPFKVAAGDLDKAKYFYGVASRLVDALRTGNGI